jgi:hypothetical protein
MHWTEEMLRGVLTKVMQQSTISLLDKEGKMIDVDFTKAWKKVRFPDLLREHANLDMFIADRKEIQKKAKEFGATKEEIENFKQLNNINIKEVEHNKTGMYILNKIEDEKPSFKIEVASTQDRRILMALGVQNSSVFLSNSTIWVEGITDRLYLRAYMKKYIQELEKNDPEKAILNNFREDYHYSFVEYQGSNLTHWSFDPDEEDIEKIKSSYVCANSFLIADGDVATKGDRVEIYKEMLGDDKFFPLDVKEIENLIPLEVLQKLVEANFKRYGGDINSIKYEDYAEKGIKVGLGEYLEKFLLSKPSKPPKKSKKSQSNMEKPENEVNELIVVYKADSGTIKSKINFCEKAIKIMEDPNFSWKLTDKLEELCKAIFEHIKSQNITK